MRAPFALQLFVLSTREHTKQLAKNLHEVATFKTHMALSRFLSLCKHHNRKHTRNSRRSAVRHGGTRRAGLPQSTVALQYRGLRTTGRCCGVRSPQRSIIDIVCARERDHSLSLRCAFICWFVFNYIAKVKTYAKKRKYTRDRNREEDVFCCIDNIQKRLLVAYDFV